MNTETTTATITGPADVIARTLKAVALYASTEQHKHHLRNIEIKQVITADTGNGAPIRSSFTATNAYHLARITAPISATETQIPAAHAVAIASEITKAIKANKGRTLTAAVQLDTTGATRITLTDSETGQQVTNTKTQLEPYGIGNFPAVFAIMSDAINGEKDTTTAISPAWLDTLSKLAAILAGSKTKAENNPINVARIHPRKPSLWTIQADDITAETIIMPMRTEGPR